MKKKKHQEVVIIVQSQKQNLKKIRSEKLNKVFLSYSNF